MLVLGFQSSIPPAAAVPDGSMYIEEYGVPTPTSGPIGIAVDSNGLIWFAETNVSRIARFSPDNLTFREYQLPLSDALRKRGAQIWGMMFDGGGCLWFTEATAASIWMFDPSAETFERYPLSPNTFPIQLKVDSSGVVWFTELYGNQIGRLDPSEAVNNTRRGITEYLIPTPDAGAIDMVFDKNGRLWFTEPFSRKVGVFDPETKSFEEYAMPETVFTLTGLTMDSRGRLWITDHGSSEFYRFDPTTGRFTEYATSMPQYLFNVSLPYYFATDSKGIIWMNIHYGNSIAMIDPDAEVLTEYSIPTRNPRFGYIADALKLVVDGDDNVWFTEWTANKIAVLDTHRTVPFGVDLSERDVTVERGGKADIIVTLQSGEPLDSPVTLIASGTTTGTGVIRGISATFEPAELFPRQRNSTLTLEVRSSLPPGPYTLMVGGQQGNVSRLAAVHLLVVSPGGASSSDAISSFVETWGIVFLALAPLIAVAMLILRRRTKIRSSA
jgi:virginiamycin B lyase